MYIFRLADVNFRSLIYGNVHLQIKQENIMALLGLVFKAPASPASPDCTTNLRSLPGEPSKAELPTKPFHAPQFQVTIAEDNSSVLAIKNPQNYYQIRQALVDAVALNSAKPLTYITINFDGRHSANSNTSGKGIGVRFDNSRQEFGIREMAGDLIKNGLLMAGGTLDFQGIGLADAENKRFDLHRSARDHDINIIAKSGNGTCLNSYFFYTFERNGTTILPSGEVVPYKGYPDLSLPRSDQRHK